MKLAPSLLASDLANLVGAVDICERGGAELIHVDVMDGHFVPNLTFGIPVIAALKERTELPLDVHLMVDSPGRLLDEYLAAGSDMVAVHWEACTHLHRVLDRIRRGHAAAGVALNPATPVEVLADVLDDLDFVLLMSVNPGFGGQSFIPRALDKTRRLRDLAGDSLDIAMDGGIDRDTIGPARAAGVDIAIAGSAVFGADDPVAAIAELRQRSLSEIS
ncbi:MAG: ribulose-phosphate 3-epimerase [Acidobacteriota bacterium]